ncbi:MAG: hypothetical protein IJK01_09095 [Clostridia bacterium]|jgi:hypothetical protein|nr:hypothetical protein [Clostridia bacterium]
MYRYEAHLHTAESSRCARVPAAEQVRVYHALGYDGVCVTDHLHNGFLNSLPRQDDWEFCMNEWLRGYRAAKAEGDALGMDVILGAELRFPENDSDYLVYGINETWLMQHPYLCRLDHKTFFERFGEEVLIIHAHPYRFTDEVFWDSVHGMEVANCSPGWDSRNELAFAFYREHPSYYPAVGSDAHCSGDQGRSAMLFPVRISDSFAWKDAIRSRNYRLWCPSFEEIVKESEAILHV